MAASESLRPVMLRSTTPAPGEKVLLYLEGMFRDTPLPPQESDHASDAGTERTETRNYPAPTVVYSPSARSHPLYHDLGPDDDLLGKTPRGLKHESFDSGPSFGNLRLPRDEGDGPSHHHWQATPARAAAISLPHSPPQSPPPPLSALTGTFQDFQPFAIPPSPKAHGMGATPSDVSPSVNINVEAPSRGPGSNLSHRAFSANEGGQDDLRQSPTLEGGPGRPWSPRSQVSVPKSRGTPKSRGGTEFPLLPPSRALSPLSDRTEMGPRQDGPRSSPRHHRTQPSRDYSDGESRLNGLRNTGGSQRTRSVTKTASVISQQPSIREHIEESNRQVTPTNSRPMSPDALDRNEEQLVQNFLDARTPRTSYLETEVQNSHFHDMDLCILLHAADDPTAHDIVRKAMRKAVRARIKKLGMASDPESINQYRRSFHDHDPSVHLQQPQSPYQYPQDPPDWAKDIMKGVVLMQQRLDSLGPKIESLRSSEASSHNDDQDHQPYEDFTPSELNGGPYPETPISQTVNIQTQRTGDDSIYQQETIITHSIPAGSHHPGESEYGPGYAAGYTNKTPPTQDGEALASVVSEMGGRGDSPGRQYLEEELYKLRVKPSSQSGHTHKTWEVAREGIDDGDDAVTETHQSASEAEFPDIPGDSRHGHGYEDRPPSPPLPPLPDEVAASSMWQQGRDSATPDHILASWQLIYQRLLSWAIVWPLSELHTALNSTTRGHQIDEVALSIWSTQCYKRYVRSKMTENPPGRVDRLFVPPNLADAISNAVYHGRHGDACAMLRELWVPFGFQGMPRLLVVLAKHRHENDHWVVHRFSLPDGTLTSYDTHPGRTLPDGRPLGWWFAIRIAWPNAIYPSPENLVQKMVRLHRPMQLSIDNSVAAAAIWRNLLMGSRAERSVDLERLRDLINTEVSNLAQRKQLGRLSINTTRQPWEGM